MTEAELRQWVDSNPSRVNDWDDYDVTPLYAAVYHKESLPLVLWLLDERGADVNTRVSGGQTPLHGACSLDVLNVLLDRGADPTLLDEYNASPLMFAANFGNVDIVARLLQESRVRAIVDVQGSKGNTALHWACTRGDEASATSIAYLLLLAGASPILVANDGRTPLAVTRQYRPTGTTTIALLEQALAEAETTSLLVKARRFVVAANATMPPCLQGREERSKPLPRVILVPVKGRSKRAKKRRKLRSMLGFLLGKKGGLKGQGVPRDLFRDVLMDFLMPVWDPLRRGYGTGPPLSG